MSAMRRADLVGEGSATITLVNAPTIPAPLISSLSPAAITAGSASQNLMINGSGFLASSSVTFNGVAHPAKFVSNSQLAIGLSASDSATVGSISVVVANP